MKYPIDAEKFVEAMRIEFGGNSTCERMYRELFIPLVNDCYYAGLSGEGCDPIDPESTLAEFAHRRGLNGIDVYTKEIFTLLVEWCNEAFILGAKDAIREVPA